MQSRYGINYPAPLDYSEEMIHTRYKKDLAGQLGNLLNRTTAKSLLPNGIIPGKVNDTVDLKDQLIHSTIVETAGKLPLILVLLPWY